MNILTTIFIFCIVILQSSFVFGIFKQSVAIKGILKCHDKVASGVKVKLWDKDKGPDFDDKLDEKVTDERGYFFLKGSTRETTNIDPVFKIYHNCDDGFMPGTRKFKYKIPKKYISSGDEIKIVCDAGVINLALTPSDAERKLF